MNNYTIVMDEASLLHDRRDVGRIFKRPHWSDDLMFSYDIRIGEYVYCVIIDGKIGFREYEDGTRRRVGAEVLASALLELKIKGKEMVDFIGGEYNVVESMYVDGTTKQYAFKIDVDIEVENGDLLVVEGTNGLGLVRVVKLHKKGLDVDTMKIFNKAKAWVVAKVDESRQKDRKEATERRAFILKQLEEKRQAMEEVEIYKMLADTDKDAAKLLKELKKLGQ